MDHQGAGYLLKSTEPHKYVGNGGIKLVLNSNQFWNYENEKEGWKFHLKANDTKLPFGNKTWTSERDHSQSYILLKDMPCGQNIEGYKLGGSEHVKDAINSQEECFRQALLST